MKKTYGPVCRLVSLTLVITLCLSLTACQSTPGTKDSGQQAESHEAANADASEQEPDPVEISLWTYPIGNWSSSTIIANLLADFNKQYPHIRISVKYLDYNTGDSLMEDAIAQASQRAEILF